MPSRPLFRIVLCGLLGLAAGFAALAIAVANEPTIPVPLLTLFSPGLKIAELIMPQEHGSLGWTFGWFLRIAIGVNAALYFAIFFVLANLLSRRPKQTY
jgi:hypothetical protein